MRRTRSAWRWWTVVLRGVAAVLFGLLALFAPQVVFLSLVLLSLIKYGEGVAARALFELDRRGKIVWSDVAPIGINPGVEGILDALEELQARKEMIHA